MTATVTLPDNPEISATRRAIAREQWRDDAFPIITPPGQLWERIAEAKPELLFLSFATHAAIWEVGRRPKWRDERGPQSRPIHHSGIIRARQRVA